MIFDWLMMAGNYEERLVANYNDGTLVVDTCSVTDGSKQFETGIQHPYYNDGDWIIVDAYDTKEDAQSGHDDWVKRMTTGDLPRTLTDCYNAELAQILQAVSAEKTGNPILDILTNNPLRFDKNDLSMWEDVL